MDVIGDYELLARTALSKSPKQLSGIIDRKLRNKFVHRLPIDFDAQYERGVPDDFSFNIGPHNKDLQAIRAVLTEKERRSYRDRAEEFLDGSVSFLNRHREIEDPATVQTGDSQLEGLPRLWYLKLVGFEPLEWVTLGFEEKESLADDSNQLGQWIRESPDQHPIGSNPGYLRGFWTPYAVCHRIINLTRYAAWCGDVDNGVQEFLFKNLLFLNNHIEEDVGGNHLIENGAALVAGGLAFGDNGKRFVDRGIGVLNQAVREQFLADGYHYERSPMYHLAVTERLISTCLLLDAAGKSYPNSLQEVTNDANAFIEHLAGPDGVIPLLNDSVLGETLQANACSMYGKKAGFTSRTEPDLDASGLVWFEHDETTLLADYGASGPENLLAHTHNDPFTICVWRGNQPIITDTGTFDYQPGNQRQRARSVQSHNTAHPEGKEPVKYGGRFLMPVQIDPTTKHIKDSFDVYYGRYSSSDARYEHGRTIVDGLNWWLIWDSIEDTATTVSRLHGAPGIDIEADSRIRFVKAGETQLQGIPVHVDDISVSSTRYYPKFGVECRRETLRLQSDDQGFGFLLSRNQVESVSVETEGSTLTEVRVADKHFKMPEISK
ncbi:heparinase II/III family protein [Natronomonas gomsonensis]|uniref:alginate lyase family protein n=1 Tax=Natronomonas gomsonensis TaxID=1046043 RepID=UPI0020CA444F|nr:alginate lyase family protein [Natronomonas gomsonensis]MCY4732425.1 heparinase II/III family protein [Natronomonas gomsonensis]